MRAVIDTSSFSALVRYYLPFEKSKQLSKFIEKKYNSGELIVLDAVYKESSFISQGIIVEALPFLKDKTMHVNTKEILAYPKIFNLLENQFCNKDTLKLKGINDAEFELEKKKYLESVDGKLMLYCDKENKSLVNDAILITEETKAANDNKLFKKLPQIFDLMQMRHCNLPALFKEHFQIKLSDYLS